MGPKRAPNKGTAVKEVAVKEATVKEVKKRKQRVGFTVAKDVILLRSVLSANPWQLGDDKWLEVVLNINDEFGGEMTVRTAKGRVATLLQKLNLQQLENNTGTEEERTDRGTLLEEISAIVEEEKASINNKINANQDDLEILSDSERNEETPEPLNTVKTRKLERKQADIERDELLANEMPGVPPRKKRCRYSVEEELIMKRQDHDMEMERKKMDLEKERLELDRQKEFRLEDEGKRRDEVAQIQLKIQSQMLELMKVVVSKD